VSAPRRRKRDPAVDRFANPIVKIGAVAGAIAAVAGLVFLFFPGLRPTTHTCPEATEGQIRNVSVTGATYADYLGQARIDSAGRSAAVLATPGFIVDYEVTTSGYRGKPLPLRWSLVDAKTGITVDDPSLKNQLALTITPDRCTYHVGHPIWVRPHATKRYYLELFLYDPGEIQLDSARSPSF
jgi:hypothetical protein